MTQGNDRERLTELMNGEIDGTNDATRSAELQDHLATDPAAHAEFDSMKGLTRRLDAVADVEPPAHLIHRIMAAVPFGRVERQAHADADGIGSWLSGFLPRPRLRFVATFATGLVAGFVLYG